MKNSEMKVAVQALGVLVNVKMPVKTGLKIRSMLRSLNHLLDDVEEERIKLIKEFSIKGEDGNPVVEDLGDGRGRYDFGDNLSDFDAEYNALMNCEVAGKPAPLTVSELGDVVIEPLILLQLGELLADESTDNE